jgi:amino acid adenylation domain-containing protein/non-ribosomal peptide synthase protein (TIGR01720 family)
MEIRDFLGAFEAAARRAPDKIAVEDAYGTVTYGQLAAALPVAGIAPGQPVGIRLAPGIGYVAAFLGVSAMRGVPMPIDVAVPPLRLERILEVSGCTRIIDTPPLPDTSAAPRVAPAPDDPAYVMFTSGSTGAPKAILGRHRGLSHFLAWEIGELGLDGSVRVSMLAPATFDVSLRDMLVPLCAGGTLCIPSDDVRTSPRRLLQWLADSRVTLMHIVPTLFRLLLAELEAGGPRPAALRHILLAGEPLYGADVLRWRAVMGGAAALFNLYGPSETTLAKAFHRIGDVPADANRVLPIGKPLPNTAFLVIDDGRLCDIGEIGEIHIKTPYRSLGYLNDPEQTAAAFIDNPLSPGHGDVVYRTGDLGRYLPDRSVECLGRLDHQVKINGVRIEPAEVESAVRRIDGVEDVAVVGHKSAQQQSVLACYYRGRGLSTSTIREQLAEALPPSMIPSFFLELDEFPMTLSGKINRRALPRPEELLYEKRPYRAPSNDVERELAAIWSDVLGLKNAGVDHAFVELGGDSLKAIRAAAAIHRAFGVDVPLKDLFAGATIATLAPRLGAAASERAGAIEPHPPAPDHPVSHAQRRLWTLQQLDPRAVAYNMPLAFRIAGPLDTERLRAAIAKIVDRHEALRTTFVMRGDEPRQRIAPPGHTHVPLVECGSLAAARDFVERDRATPFDLERGPLFRAALLSLGDRDHVLAICLHHIVCDVWSLDVIARELGALYSDPAATLVPPRIHYRDFAEWQNARIAGGDLAADRAFWLERFAGDLPRLELPTDFPRPAVQTFRGKTHRRRLDIPLHGLGASPFVVLQACVKALLHRWSGQRDVVVGTPVVGRQHRDLEQQVGLYVNTLALRDDVDPSLPFAGLVARVQQSTYDALEHQSYPFDMLVGELPLERDMSHSPLFDVLVVVQDEAPEPLRLAGARSEPFERENVWNFSRFDLVFYFTTGGGELLLDLNYNTDLFRAERAASIAAQLETLLRAAAADPARPVAALDVVPEPEQARLARFAAEPDRHPPGLTVTGRFEAQVAATPHAPAVVHGDAAVTYAALDARANRIAHALRARGAGRGDRVAVSLRRSIDAMAAILGVMKSGAIYVPLDPDLPPARRNAILADAEPKAVIEAGAIPLAGRDDDPRAGVAPDDVAYMIYTSGSTGAPKGVLVRHDGFVNMSLCQIAAFGIEARDRVAQFAAATFDASLAEIFAAWFRGAALVLLDRELIEHPPDFLAALEAQRVSVITLPPVYLAALNRAPMPSVRILITAGEAARAADLQHYASTRACFNAYGPTETSVCAAMHHVAAGSSAATVPIGRPVDGTTVLVLDQQLAPVPVGVPGEICVAGRGLALGYHRNAEATAERFIVHNGVRMYRTGDRGRWNFDGELEFLGRLDDQLKVHGHRIEAGAVEAALRQCGAGDAYVTAVDGELAAYVTPPRRLELWPSVAEFFVYDDVLYGSMAADEERNRAYAAVFAEALPGRSVVEIGPGPECVLSRLALDAGAEHVYAIELLDETFARARATVDRLGLANRITLIRGDARTAALPRQVDACISEIVGAIGGSEGAAAIINAARRFLIDGRNMIPRRGVTRIAAAAIDDAALSWAFPDIAAHYVQRIFDDAGAPFDLRLCLKNAGPEHLLSSAGVFEDLDFTADVPLESQHDVELRVERAGAMTGFLVWLELHVGGQHVVDILRNQASWLPVYIPLFAQPVSVAAGDVIRFTVTRTLDADGLHPDFALRGLLRGIPIDAASPHRAKAFRATPFYDRLFAGGVPVERPAGLGELRARLAERLPRYEIPAHIVRMERLPLNSSGKVDRRALPDPRAAARPAVEAGAPLSAREAEIAAAWSEVLRHEVGAEENFFSAGGDSIAAIRIVSLLHQRNIRLELRDIFQHPTVRACAAAATTAADGIESIDQTPFAGELPPTPVQRWFFDEVRVAPHHYNQSVVLRPLGPLDAARVRNALDAVLRHHDALRMRAEEGRLFVDAEPVVALDEIACDEAGWRELAGPVHAGFDLARGPLVRALLLHLPDGDALWLVCHHLVIDLVSWAILIDDLEAAYLGQALPPKTHSIAAFARALAERAAGEELQRERPYWERVARGDSVALPAPTAAEAVEIDCTPTETAALLAAAGKPSEVLLTALALAMRSWSGSDRLLVDLESHGRDAAPRGLDVSRTIGWFTAFHPIVLDAAGGDPAAALARTRKALAAVPNGGTGYGLLTRLAPDPLPPAHPPAGFNFLGELTSARTGRLFRVEWDAPGPATSPAAPPAHPIDVLAVILDGRLRITLTCADARLAEHLRDALRQLAGAAPAMAFALDGISAEELDEIVAGLE